MEITLIKPKGDKKAKYVIIYGMAAWPMRSLKHRGWAGGLILYSRPATEDELKEARGSSRFLSYRYKDIQTVANDEATYGVNIRELIPENIWRILHED